MSVDDLLLTFVKKTTKDYNSAMRVLIAPAIDKHTSLSQLNPSNHYGYTIPELYSRRTNHEGRTNKGKTIIISRHSVGDSKMTQVNMTTNVT